MSRRKAVAEQTRDPEAIGAAVDQVVSQAQDDAGGDIFDEQARLREQERQAAEAQRTPPATQAEQQPASREPNDGEPASATHASRVTPNGERQRAKIPDPFGILGIALTDEKDGPRAHLLRSRDHNDMWIQFDENPGREITDQIKAEGFRWEPRAWSGDRKGAWVKPLEEGQEWRTQADAERLLRDMANQIREKNGLEPVTVMGVQDR